jgi:hypothetical protein
MAETIPDETRYYFTDEATSLPAGSRPTLAREDGTKWVQDSDCQVHGLAGAFTKDEMAKYRNGKFITYAQLKREYEAKWGPNGFLTVGE